MKVVVVGGGAYGLSCAERLARGGAEVVLLERDVPGHAWAASGGLTRVLRLEYGEQARYTELTVCARELWRTLERAAGTPLFLETGVLHLAVGDAAWERASLEVVRAAGFACDLLEPAEIARRWPAFDLAGVTAGLYSPSGGLLWARRATRVLAERAGASGVQVRTGAPVAEVADGAAVLEDGTRIAADRAVVCTGAWSGLLDDRLAAVVPRRQVTAYLEADLPSIPVWAYGPLDFYGFPSHDGYGLKIGWHRTVDGPIGDPSDARARRADDADVAELRAFAAERFGLRDPAVQAAEVCFYAMTADEHPIADWLDERTFACCGLSGHGFKFSVALGPAVAERVLEIEPSFDLAGFELGRAALQTPA